MYQITSAMEFTYSSFSAHLRLVGQPYFLRVWVSSLYRVSARRWGIPSHAKMRITMTAVWQWCPARCRTKHSSFSSSPLLRITCKTYVEVCRFIWKDRRSWLQLFAQKKLYIARFLLLYYYDLYHLHTSVIFYYWYHCHRFVVTQNSPKSQQLQVKLNVINGQLIYRYALVSMGDRFLVP